MGGKGSSTTPENWPQETGPDMTGMFMEAFGSMMEANQANMEALIASQSQVMPPLPQVFKGPDIDWTSEQQKLSQKVKADQEIADKQKRGRASTIITSPLVDEEDVDTTKAVLGR